jgi:hypothetical protein
MRKTRFKSFTAVYILVALALVGFGIASQNFLVIGLGLLTFLLALCRSFEWWYRTTIALGKVNVIFGWTAIAILVSLQIYGLLSGSFGISPSLISLLILTLLATADTVNILKSFR